MSARKFRGQIFDPLDTVTVFQERFNQQNIGLVFSDQFARIVETVCTAANLISLVAPDDCGQSLCTDTRVPGHDHPCWLRAPFAKSAQYFHGYTVITGWSAFLESKKKSRFTRKNVLPATPLFLLLFPRPHSIPSSFFRVLLA